MLALFLSTALAFHAPSGSEILSVELPAPGHPRKRAARCEVVLAADVNGVPTPMTTFHGYRDECDPDVSASVLAAASHWRFAPNQPELLRQLWVTFQVRADGTSRAILTGKTADPLPEGVVLAAPASGVPKLDVPTDMAEELGDVVCSFALDVDEEGKVRSEAEPGCALDYREKISKRLDDDVLVPRKVDGEPIPGKLLAWVRLPHGANAGPAEVRTQPYDPTTEPMFHLVNGIGVRAFRQPIVPVRPPSFSICEVVWDVGAGTATPRTLDCAEGLEGPVLAAARDWRFGDPVDATTTVTAIFAAFPDGRTVIGVPSRNGALDDPLPDGVTILDVPVIERGSNLTWPKAALDAPKAGVECTYDISVDPDGAVENVDASRCPEAYRENNTALIGKWRFAPAKIEGRRIPSTFRLNLIYRPPRGTERPVESKGPAKSKVVPTESALFRMPKPDVGITDAVLPSLAARPSSLQYCEVSFEIGRNVAPSARWCTGEYRQKVEAAAAGWKFVTAEPGPKSRSMGFYAFPDGRIVAALWGESPDAHPVPYGIVYGQPARPKRAVPPAFPRSVKDAVDLSCRTKLLVGANGRVREMSTPECPEPFAGAVARRVKKWTFVPATVDGTPVPSEYDVKTAFRK